MKKLFFIIILFSCCVQAQVTIIPYTRCHGFSLTSSGGITKTSDQTNSYLVTSLGTYTCFIDSVLNLTGYDSLKITIVSNQSAGAGPNNFVNAFSYTAPVSGPHTFTYNTTNISVLTLNFTLTTPASIPNVTTCIFGVMIDGYPTTSSVKKNSLRDDVDFFMHKNTLTVTDKINGNYQLVVVDLTGKTILSKELESVNEFDLPTNFYLVQILADNVAIKSKKVFISN